jgi:hypothetical protein
MECRGVLTPAEAPRLYQPAPSAWTARHTAVELLAGGLAGAGMILVSHPADTVKLLLQVRVA